jgi:hypothetical protein
MTWMALFAVLKIHTTHEMGGGEMLWICWPVEDIVFLRITIFTGFEAHSHTYPHIYAHGDGSALDPSIDSIR